MASPLKPRPEDIPFLRRLGWTIAIGAALLVVWRAADLLLLAFGSVLGAVMFRSAARLFRRIGIRHEQVSLGLGMVLSLGLFGVIGWLLTVQFGDPIADMLSNLPGTIDSIERSLSTTRVGAAIVDAVDAATGGAKIANGLGDLAKGAGQVLLNFLIVIIGAMFIAVNPGPYIKAVVLLTPPAGRGVVEKALGEIRIALRLWLRAKLISMVVMTVVIGGSLRLAGLDNWAALGLLGGLSEFVPYVGPALAMLPAVGLAASAGSDVLLKTIVAYIAVRLIEAWMLSPWINRRVVRIPPALTLFTILAAGAVFGVYGVFFAGALLVVGFVAVRELYLRETLGEDIEGVPREAKE